MKEEDLGLDAIFRRGRHEAICGTKDPADALNGDMDLKMAPVPFFVYPKDCEIKDLQEYLPAPRRIMAKPRFYDVESFLAYTKEFAEPGTRVFVDYSNLTFTTVIDCHAKDKPAWGGHKATLALSVAHEFKKFVDQNMVEMKPQQFAEFIEDNLEYIEASVSHDVDGVESENALKGSDLLSMAQSFKIKIDGDAEVQESLHSGMRKLFIEDRSKVTATNTQGKSLPFPDRFKIRVRVYQHGEEFHVSCWLRYRKTEKGLVFMIKIPDPEQIREKAFQEIVEGIKEKSGLTVMYGAL